eukprot:1903031-Rhodomonas_salina.1
MMMILARVSSSSRLREAEWTLTRNPPPPPPPTSYSTLPSRSREREKVSVCVCASQASVASSEELLTAHVRETEPRGTRVRDSRRQPQKNNEECNRRQNHTAFPIAQLLSVTSSLESHTLAINDPIIVITFQRSRACLRSRLRPTRPRSVPDIA